MQEMLDSLLLESQALRLPMARQQDLIDVKKTLTAISKMREK